MKRYFTTLIISIIISACASNQDKAIEHFERAQKLYKEDKIKDASIEIDSAINLDKSNLDFQITKAKIIAKTDNYELAISILQEVLNQNFKVDTVNYYLGDSYFGYGSYFSKKQKVKESATGSFEKAVYYYNEAINNNAQYFEAYVAKSRAFHNQSKSDEALVVLNTAINLFPDSISLLYNRGVEKIYIGDLAGAMIDLNGSIQSNSLDSINQATAYRFRGLLHQKNNDLDSAIDDLTNALHYNPKDEYALYNRADCYREKGLKEKACNDYRRAADLGFVNLYATIKEYCGN